MSPVIGATLITNSAVVANGVASTEQSSPGAVSAGAASVSPTPSSEHEPSLNKVVTQLNAKLGTEIFPRPNNGRESIHSLPRASPAMTALPAPPAPPAHLTSMHHHHHPSQQRGLYAASPAAAAAAAYHGQPVTGLQHAMPAHQQLLMAQHGLLPAHAAGLMQGQHAMLQGQHAMLQGHPGLMQGQHALMQGQHALLQGQPGLLQSPGVPQGMAGLYPGNHVMLPNGMALQRPGMPQMIQMAGMPGAYQGMLPAGMRPQLYQMAQARAAAAAEATHVPTAGYVANNVSGYTPASSGQAGPAQVGQPIPVLANGMVNMSGNGLQQAAAQPVLQMAGMPGVGNMVSVAGMHGFPAGMAPINAMPGMSGMQTLQGLQGMAGLQSLQSLQGLQSLQAMQGTPQSMAGLMMTPSPAGLPAGLPAAHQLAYAAQQPWLQKMPTAMQPGLIQGGHAGLPQLQNHVALAQSLKRPLGEPMSVIDKRLRLA